MCSAPPRLPHAQRIALTTQDRLLVAASRSFSRFEDRRHTHVFEEAGKRGRCFGLDSVPTQSASQRICTPREQEGNEL
jgi:hypothetical protein